jgi:hypothetical protein
MRAIHKKRIRKLAAYLAGPVARADAKARRKGRFKFDMITWCQWNNNEAERKHHYGYPNRVGLDKAHCGTAACALGWATAIFPQLRLSCGQVVGNSRGFFGMDHRQFSKAFTPLDKVGMIAVRTPKEAARALRAIANEG